MRQVARMRVLSVVLGSMSCLALAGVAPVLAATGSISGTVSDAVGHEGVDNIRVCAIQSFPGLGSECEFTDEDGNYTIQGLQPSVYKVVFAEETSQNYLAQWYDGKATRDEAIGIAVGDGAAVTGIDAALEVGGQIAGTVTDVGDGEPIEGIEVCARQVDRIFELSVIQCDRTDAEGGYAVQSLPTGQFKLEFGPAIFQRGAPNYIRQYYPGKSSWSEAEVRAVTAGTVQTGVDAALQRGIGVAGTVSEVGGAPVTTGSTRVCAHDAASEAIVTCTGVEMDGAYWMPGLPFGSYRVSFSVDVEEDGVVLHPDGFVRQYYNGKPTFAAADVLSSAGPTVFSDIDAQLVRGPEVFPAKPLPPQPLIVTFAERPAPQPLRCKKGFRKKFVKGKHRCVKLRKEHRRHSRKGPHAEATGR